MQRRTVDNISAVAIIANGANPSRMFLEVKDDGHPIKLVRRALCPIGGNWIGEAAKSDTSPLATLRREIAEELSLDRPRRSGLELRQLGTAGPEIFEATPINPIEVTTVDREALHKVSQAICQRLQFFMARINTVTKLAMDAVDPTNKREGFSTLSFYFVAFLPQATWDTLEQLQKKYGNLSNEAVTVMADLPLHRDLRCAFGHDGALKRYGLTFVAEDCPPPTAIEGVKSERCATDPFTYKDILARFAVVKRPPGC